MSLLRLMKTRLAFRTAVIILAFILLFGVVMTGVSVVISYERARDYQYRQLDSLLTTVMETARIAVFLDDRQLASDITRGLIANDVVAAVSITTGDQILSERSKPAASYPGYWAQQSPHTIRYPVTSPFPPEKTLGEITLTSNPQVISESIRTSIALTLVVLVTEIVAVGGVIVWVVMWLVTRPITRISRRLHTLNVSLGEKLTLPSARHEHDEIGLLVRDVNAMIDKLVALLNTEKSLRHEKEQNEKKFRSIFDNAASAIFVIDRQGALHSYNPAFTRLFAAADSELASQSPPNLFDLVADGAGALDEKIEAALAAGETQELELQWQPSRWLKLVLTPVDKGELQVVASEITELKAAFTEAEKKATTDALTGVGNRLGAEQQLAALLRPPLTSEPGAEPLSLIFLDLDHFKEVNDTFGHQAGDVLLRRVTDIIQGLIRKTDYCARLGGDEFVVLLPRDEDTAAIRFAEALLEALQEPIAIGNGETARVDASIGIARGRPGETAPADLLQQADKAMYVAKEGGRNRYCLYASLQGDSELPTEAGRL